MKILIINTSPRNKGTTGIILQHLHSCLENYEDVDINHINIASLKLNYCTGCGICFKTGSCFMKDDLENLSIEIAKADGVILASPTYVSNVSGQMKTLIDRGHFVLEQLLYNKYAMYVVTYENYGGKTASNILHNLLSYSGAQISGKMLVKTPLSNNIDGLAHRNAKKFYNDIKNKKQYFLQNLKHSIIFHIGIKPYIMKNQIDYAGVIEHWKKRNLF